MNSEIVLSVSGVGKRYRLYPQPSGRLVEWCTGGRLRRHHELIALAEISFDVQRGEAFGIMGRNGAGKTTLLSTLSGLVVPTSGTIRKPDNTANLVNLGAGFDFDLSGRDNIVHLLRILGSVAINPKIRQQIEDFSELGEALDRPFRTYSSGMQLRLAFAIAISSEPDLLIVDEILAVGDLFFRQRCYERIAALRARGTSVVLVSHNTAEIAQLCTRALILEQGRCVFMGDAKEAVARYAAGLRPGGGGEPSNPSAKRGVEPGQQSFWPAEIASIDMSTCKAVSNGRAEISRLALVDATARPCNVLPAGHSVRLFIEVTAVENLDVPVVGWKLLDQRNIVVCGVSSHFHSPSGWPKQLLAGQSLTVEFLVQFPLQSGEYSLTVLIGDISAADHAARGGGNGSFSAIRRISTIDQATIFAIIPDPTRQPTQMSHFGLAGVPCDMTCRGDLVQNNEIGKGLLS